MSRDEWFRDTVSGQRRGLVANVNRALMSVLSIPYGIAVRSRNFAFDVGWKRAERVGVPVISVGNLSMGGTGKTPFVEWLARYLSDSGRRVAILSRGYGSSQGRNDEAMVLEENLPDVPHLQGADRVVLAMTAIEELECDLLLLDDGFQHRRLARDLDIVLIDVSVPAVAEQLFPRGYFREPISALRRALMVILTRCPTVDAPEVLRWQQLLARRYPSLAVVPSAHTPLGWVDDAGNLEPLEALTGRPVLGFCGLGNPEAFRRSLVSTGVELLGFRAFPDHHLYCRDDVASLSEWAAAHPVETLLVTTQKDFVKLRIGELAGRRLRTLKIGLTFFGQEVTLSQRIESALPAIPSD